MSSTAWTTPSSVLNSTARFSIDRTGSGTNSPLLRIQSVPEAVADEVDGDHDEQQHETGEDRDPPLLRELLAARDERAERRRRRLDAETEEGQSRLDDDRRADRKRAADDDRPQRVREDVPEHDPHVAGPGGLRSLDVLLLTQREEDAAHDTGESRPEEEHEDDRDAPLTALAEQRRRREQDRERRQRKHEVGDSHEDVVDPAAVVA